MPDLSPFMMNLNSYSTMSKLEVDILTHEEHCLSVKLYRLIVR